MSEPIVLGIETSCDETAVGIVRGRTLLANVIASSVEEHARFGGVVPEIASRAHLEAMIPTLHQALKDSKLSLKDIDAVAVTGGPGLVGALLVGVGSAAGLALGLNKPIYAVNHLAAHVSVDSLTHSNPLDPTIALLVSGGHSSLLQVDDITGSITKLGETMDDAAGEAFDKIARVMKLGFPGGPAIDKLSHEGSATAIDFPRGLTTSNDWLTRPFDFSFSGLKTAVARYGGVAANSRLRVVAQERCDKAGIGLRVPSPGLCTDNGAMVAALGSLMVSAGREPSPVAFDADSSLPVTTVCL